MFGGDTGRFGDLFFSTAVGVKARTTLSPNVLAGVGYLSRGWFDTAGHDVIALTAEAGVVPLSPRCGSRKGASRAGSEARRNRKRIRAGPGEEGDDEDGDDGRAPPQPSRGESAPRGRGVGCGPAFVHAHPHATHGTPLRWNWDAGRAPGGAHGPRMRQRSARSTIRPSGR